MFCKTGTPVKIEKVEKRGNSIEVICSVCGKRYLPADSCPYCTDSVIKESNNELA